MSIIQVRDVFLWTTVFNYALLIIWALLSLFAGDWVFGLWGRWFGIAPERAKSWNFGGIMIYKLGIILFNLGPLIALLVVGSR